MIQHLGDVPNIWEQFLHHLTQSIVHRVVIDGGHMETDIHIQQVEVTQLSSHADLVVIVGIYMEI